MASAQPEAIIFMSYFDAVILGLIQGLTEFLPVSSSGHLVLTENILGLKLPGVVFELMLHFGTLFSVIIYFRKRIAALIKSLFIRDMAAERRMVLYLAVGTVPAVVAALLFEKMFKLAFDSALFTTGMLIVTGLLLISTAAVKKTDRDLTFGRAIFIGIGQAMAILPGISRSGSTISFGLFSGIKPVLAAEFSFILAIPAIAGAIIFNIRDIAVVEPALMGHYLIGAAVSFLSGLLAVYVLLDVVRRGKFMYFGFYCLLVGTAGLIYFIRS